jgi:hypothetical protein
MKDFFTKKLLIHLGMIALGLLLSYVLFFTPVLSGKTLSQSDTSHSNAMMKEVSDFEEKTGEKSLWTNSLFGGMPTYMIKADQDNNIFQYITKSLRFGLPFGTVGILFTYFLFIYILLVVMKMEPLEAFLGALMFGLSTYNIIIIEAGHITKAYAIGYIPLILTGIFLAFRQKYLLGGIITCVGLGVQIYTNHFQITYYTGIMVGLFLICWLVYALIHKEIAVWLKGASTVVIASLMAVLPNISHLWTTYEYQQETMRGGSELTPKDSTAKSTGLKKDYAFDWSQGKAETFTLLIPHFMGGGSQENIGKDSKTYEAVKEKAGQEQAEQIAKGAPTYWGDQPGTSGAIYFGCVAVFLGLLGFLLIKGPLKWWLIAGTIISIFLSWGRNLMGLNGFLFDHFPLYNKFRSVSMWLSLTSLLVVLSAILGIHEFIKNHESNKEKYTKLLYIAYGVTAGLCLFMGLFGGEFFDFQSPNDAQLLQRGFPQWLIDAVIEDRADMMQSDAFRSFGLISLAFLGLMAITKKALKTEYILVALCLLTLIDIYKIDKAFFAEDKFKREKKNQAEIEPNSANTMILEDKDPDYRVLNLTTDTYNEAYTSYFHKSVGGYHPAKLRRYQDLIENHISQRHLPVINMLNTKYIIVDNNQQLQVIKNDSACGNAWFADTLVITKTPEEELDTLDGINPKHFAAIDQNFYSKLAAKKTVYSANGSIQLTSYKPNELIYSSTSKNTGFAVFSEIYYPYGWKASIDGKAVDHVRVDYILRGLEVPAGKHEIKFVFSPDSFNVGSKISGISSVAILIILLLSIGMAVYKRKEA